MRSEQRLLVASETTRTSLHQSPECWLMKKSLEEGEKSINQLVRKSQKVRWPQNECEGEV